MPRIKFSQEDLMSATQLEPAWYKLKIKAITEESSKDGDSMNWIVDVIVFDGPKAGTPIRAYLNEKGPGMGVRVNFIQSFVGGKLEKDKDYGELDQLVGREASGYCFYDPERRWNTIKDFKPIGTGAKA